MMAVKMPTSLGSIARSFATAGIMTPSASTQSETIAWMASMVATGTTARCMAKRLHPVEVGLVQHRVAQDADRGDVDHDAVDVDGAQALRLGLGIGLLELARPRHVLGLGRIDLQRMLDLRGMDRPLADAAQNHRALALLAIGLGIAEVGERAVDRVDAGGATGHHQPEAGIVPEVAGITVDGVEMLARAFDNFDDVLEGIFSGEVVDAHATRLALPVERLQRGHDLLAGVALLAGGDGVLEVEEDMVGLGLGCLLHHLLARAGRGKLHAAGAARTGGHVISPPATIFSARRRAISASPRPRRVRYSSVCSPSKGARWRTRPGVSLILMATPATFMSPSRPGWGTDTTMSRAAKCGLAKTSRTSLTGANGTWPPRWARSSSLVRWLVKADTATMISSWWARRSWTVENRGSVPISGRPIRRHRIGKWVSAWAAMVTWPSLAGNMPNGQSRGWWLPSGTGTPPVKECWCTMRSHIDRMASTMPTSTNWPRPVLWARRMALTMPTAHMVAGIRSPMPGPTFIGVSLSGPVIAMTPPNAWATTS